MNLTPKTPTALGKILLSLGFIFISSVYAFRQNLGSTFQDLSTPAVRQGDSNSSASLSPGQSYKAANDALLQTLAQITGSGQSVQPTPTPTTTTKTQTNTTKTPTPTTTKTPTPTPVPTPTTQKTTGKYADGSYTGSAVDAYYGTVQVKAIVKNGQLADVQFLQYPNDRSNSRYINGQAMPLLTQEAIQAQSAQVDGVSGATFTSQAFQESLTVALASAKN